MKISPVKAELFNEDGPSGGHDEANRRFLPNAKTPKIRKNSQFSKEGLRSR
jgi:hypothetical protein